MLLDRIHKKKFLVKSNVIFVALTLVSTSLKCAPYSLLSFFFTCVPKFVNASGTSAPASLSTFASSPALALSCTVNNVCAMPVFPARPVRPILCT